MPAISLQLSAIQTQVDESLVFNNKKTKKQKLCSVMPIQPFYFHQNSDSLLSTIMLLNFLVCSLLCIART